MRARNNTINGMLKTMLGLLAVILVGLMSPQQAQAQLPAPPPVTLNYTFNIPVVKVVPNPCTTGFVLINGSLNVNIGTTQDSTGFRFTLGMTSTGTGKDASVDGIAILGNPDYTYNSTMKADASFPKKPAYFSIEVPNGDALFRQFVDSSDSFTLDTDLTLVFVNGAPSVPTINNLNVRCNSAE